MQYNQGIKTKFPLSGTFIENCDLVPAIFYRGTNFDKITLGTYRTVVQDGEMKTVANIYYSQLPIPQDLCCNCGGNCGITKSKTKELAKTQIHGIITSIYSSLMLLRLVYHFCSLECNDKFIIRVYCAYYGKAKDQIPLAFSELFELIDNGNNGLKEKMQIVKTFKTFEQLDDYAVGKMLPRSDKETMVEIFKILNKL
jgi:hypothetical protein